MKRLLVCTVLAFSVAGNAQAQPRPSFHEAEADLAMELSRRAPLPWQPLALMALDTALPLVAGVVGAGTGCVIGGALFMASGRTPFSLTAWPIRDTFLTFMAVGALTGGTLSILAADLTLNTRHLSRVLPARTAWTLLMLPAPVMLTVSTLTQGYSSLPPWLSLTSVYATRVVWLASLACAPPLALALSLWTREKTDDRQGSALWEPDAN